MALSKQDYVTLARFRRALRRFLRFTEQGARLEGLTPQQHQVLLAIKGTPDAEAASIAAIADALQLRHHTTSELVSRCVENGYLATHKDAADHRRVLASLTPKGEEILARLSERNWRELETLRAIFEMSPTNSN